MEENNGLLLCQLNDYLEKDGTWGALSLENVWFFTADGNEKAVHEDFSLLFAPQVEMIRNI